MSNPSKPMLGEILVKTGIISSEDLSMALSEQRAKGGRLGEILFRRGRIGFSSLSWALAHQTAIG